MTIAPDPAQDPAHAPKPMRERVKEGTPGAELWAPFGEHMKAAVISAIPFLVILIIANGAGVPGDANIVERLITGLNLTGLLFATGGLLIGPGILLAYCALWSLMSRRVLRLLRHRDDLAPHLIGYALAGAAGLFVAAMVLLTIGRLINGDGLNIVSAPTFRGLAIGSPFLGAAGAVLGLFALRRSIGWYVLRERPPLPDVFRFVDRKRDKDDFERM